MSETTNISWTDSTWNPWRGCRAVSPGCQNCYAKALVNGRMAGDFSKRVRAADHTFNSPLRWNKNPQVCECCHYEFGGSPAWCPRCEGHERGEQKVRRRRVFLGSLMDWLDPEIPVEWLAEALDIIRRCPDLIFQCVTKRPELFSKRLRQVLDWCWTQKAPSRWRVDGQFQYWLARWQAQGIAPHNVWVIASVEDQKRADERIPELLKIPAVVRGLSVEPLLERVNLHLTRPPAAGGQTMPGPLGIHWVITGGESGPHRRDCGVDAILDVARQCQAANVPVFIKQDCAFKPGQQGRIHDEIWNLKQFPA